MQLAHLSDTFVFATSIPFAPECFGNSNESSTIEFGISFHFFLTWSLLTSFQLLQQIQSVILFFVQFSIQFRIYGTWNDFVNRNEVIWNLIIACCEFRHFRKNEKKNSWAMQMDSTVASNIQRMCIAGIYKFFQFENAPSTNTNTKCRYWMHMIDDVVPEKLYIFATHICCPNVHITKIYH